MTDTTETTQPTSTPPAKKAGAKKTTAAKRTPSTFKVGEHVDVPDGTSITRPDESVVTVSGDQYVLDVPGTFRLGDREVTAK